MSNNQNNQNSNNYNRTNYPVGANYPETKDEVVDAAPETKKGKNGKKIIIPIICALLIIAVAVSAFFIVKGTKKKNKGDNPAPAPTAPAQETANTGNDAPIEQEPVDVHTFEFYARTKSDESKLGSCAKVLEKRLEIAGVEGTVEVQGKKIVVVLPTNFAASLDEKDQFIELLSSKGDLSFGNSSVSISEQCNDSLKEIKIVEKDKAEYLRYVSEEIESYYTEAIEEDDADKCYILQITLDEVGAAELENATSRSYSGKTWAFIDAEIMSSGTGSISGFQVSVGAAINVSDEEFYNVDILPHKIYANKNAVEMLKYIIENEPMECALDYECKDAPLWEESGDMGKNQVKSVDGDVVVLEYKTYYAPDDLTDEDFKNSVKVVKNRLDALGISYAFGYGKYNPENIAIMISPKDVSSDVVRMFGGTRSIDFYNQFENTGLYASEFKIAKDDNNQMCFEVEFFDTAEDVKAQFTGERFEDEEILPENMSTMYLVVNDVTIASADINDLSSKDESYSCIRFNNLLCMNKDQMDNSDANFAEFIVTIEKEEYDDMEVSWELAEYTYYKDGNQKDIDFSKLPWACNKHVVDNDIFDIAKKYNGTISKSFSERNALEIEIDIPIDENLPTNFTEKVKAIFDECNFEKGAYASIEFSVKMPEDPHPIDSANISFDKYDLKMSFSGEKFNGPNFVEYAIDVETICETDEFFTSKALY